MTGKIEQDREPTTIEQWRDRTLMATDPVEATYWLTHVADAFAVHWGASEPLSTCNEWGQAFRYVVKLFVDAEIEALTRRIEHARMRAGQMALRVGALREGLREARDAASVEDVRFIAANALEEDDDRESRQYDDEPTPSKIEALTRRNAELTAALGDAEDAWIDSDVHPRDAAGTCEHCDRIAAIFAALTPTESEAK